jgi:hypothetical protein
MICAWIFSDIIDMPCSWEIVFELMEGASHHSICQIESLLDSIPMMNVDIDVKDSLVCFKQLQNGQYAIVDITKSWCFWLLGVMQSSRPVDSISEFALPQKSSSGWDMLSNTDWSARIAHAIVVKPLHDWTVLLEIEAIKLVFVISSIFGSDSADEVDVLIGVEGGELFLSSVVLIKICELKVLSRWMGTIV